MNSYNSHPSSVRQEHHYAHFTDGAMRHQETHVHIAKKLWGWDLSPSISWIQNMATATKIYYAALFFLTVKDFEVDQLHVLLILLVLPHQTWMYLLPHTLGLSLFGVHVSNFVKNLVIFMTQFKCFFLQAVQSFNRVWLFVTPRTAAHQTSLSIINSWSLLKLMSIESVMPSNHLILCHPGGLPWTFPSLGSQSLLSSGLIAHHSALSVCLHLRMHVLSWLNSGARLPKTESWLCHLLPAWPWEVDLNLSACFSLLTYKMGMIMWGLKDHTTVKNLEHCLVKSKSFISIPLQTLNTVRADFWISQDWYSIWHIVGAQ